RHQPPSSTLHHIAGASDTAIIVKKRQVTEKFPFLAITDDLQVQITSLLWFPARRGRTKPQQLHGLFNTFASTSWVSLLLYVPIIILYVVFLKLKRTYLPNCNILHSASWDIPHGPGGHLPRGIARGGNLLPSWTWHLKGSPIEIVNEYPYLGVIFTPSELIPGPLA
ncbi:unnamed protein product, partial [Allacma fusca]